MSKGQRSRSQGHKVHNVVTRHRTVSSRNETVPRGCLVIEGDRVVGFSYALYRVLSQVLVDDIIILYFSYYYCVDETGGRVTDGFLDQ